jgi:uncharacterized protein YutE (UPF0331/DUF86 family)
MTLRPAVVHERLRKLREILTNLEEVRKVPREDFVASFRHYWLAERGLHLAAETVFDIGNHLLAGHFNVHPADYEQVLVKLEERGVISPGLLERITGLGGFRNVLVHGYLEIDEERVYESLQNELGAFDAFAQEIEGFVSRLTPERP